MRYLVLYRKTTVTSFVYITYVLSLVRRKHISIIYERLEIGLQSLLVNVAVFQRAVKNHQIVGNKNQDHLWTPLRLGFHLQ